MSAILERATADAASASKMPHAEKTYDREANDVGNILALDHINLVVPDQRSATAFYVMGLGFTRDPFLRVGLSSMTINVGNSQFHLSTAGRDDLPSASGIKLTPQRLRGTIGFVVSDLGELAKRLDKVAPLLEGSQFGYKVHADHVAVTCPAGNRFRCHAPSPEFGDTELAIAYIEFDVPRGSAAGIARFYRDGFLAATKVEQKGGDAVACVTVGTQNFFFRETDAPIPPYDGHHVAVYVANHSAPHRFLKKHNIEVVENNAHQYRFRDIIDPENGNDLFTVEHEVRSIQHRLYNTPLINRNPAQTTEHGKRGHDAFRGSY